MERCIQIQEAIAKGDEKYRLINNTKAKSLIWQMFHLIECCGEILNFVCCKKCKVVFAYTAKAGQPTLPSFVNKNVPQNFIDNLAIKQLAFVVKDLQPLSVTEGQLKYMHSYVHIYIYTHSYVQ